jgi:ATP/maltotriose-dependent transcriptional regulator MalT
MGKRHNVASPERLNRRDGGCEEHDSCLVCPLPTCRYDLPQGIYGLRVAERGAEVMRLHGSGLSRQEIARRLGLKADTVSSIIRRLRQERVGAGETTR